MCPNVKKPDYYFGLNWKASRKFESKKVVRLIEQVE